MRRRIHALGGSEGVQHFTASWNDVLATVDTYLSGS